MDSVLGNPEWLATAFAMLAGGALLGILYFLGLWWTVSRLDSKTNPALFLMGSAGLRMIILIAGLAWLSGGVGWQLGFALLGVILGRVIAVKRLGRLRQP